MNITINRSVMVFFGVFIFYVYFARAILFYITNYEPRIFQLTTEIGHLLLLLTLYSAFFFFLVISSSVLANSILHYIKFRFWVSWKNFCWIFATVWFVASVVVIYQNGLKDVRHSAGGLSSFGPFLKVQYSLSFLSNVILLSELLKVRTKDACRKLNLVLLICSVLSIYSLAALVSAVFWFMLFLKPKLSLIGIKFRMHHILYICFIASVSLFGILTIKSGGFAALLSARSVFTIDYFATLFIERTSVDVLSFSAATTHNTSSFIEDYYVGIFSDRLGEIFGLTVPDGYSLSRKNYLGLVAGEPLALAGVEPGLLGSIAYLGFYNIFTPLLLLPIVIYISSLPRITIISAILIYWFAMPSLSVLYRGAVFVDPIFGFNLLLLSSAIRNRMHLKSIRAIV